MLKYENGSWGKSLPKREPGLLQVLFIAQIQFVLNTGCGAITSFKPC